MMLICADGRSVGMISGGCLEPHIIKRAFWLTRLGASVQVYQTGDDIEYHDRDDNNADFAAKKAYEYNSDFLDDDLDGEMNFGLGCNGRVHVLFERLVSASLLINLIRQVRSDQQPVTIATLIRFNNCVSQNAQLQIGMRIDLDAHSDIGQLTAIDDKQDVLNSARTSLNNTFAHTIKELAKHDLDKKNTDYVIMESAVEQSTKHKMEQNSVPKLIKTEWLLQRIKPQVRLLICGAGNDVVPLVTMAKLQDWHVTVVDSRAQYATRMRFSQADIVMCLPLDDTERLIKLSANAAVALMSHSLAQDRARLAVLLEHSAQCKYKYLGQLGPRYRTERLIEEISATKSDSSALTDGIRQLHYPIGFKLGGDGPEALALSIMAQISAVMHEQVPFFNDSDNAQLLSKGVFINSNMDDYAHN